MVVRICLSRGVLVFCVGQCLEKSQDLWVGAPTWAWIATLTPCFLAQQNLLLKAMT